MLSPACRVLLSCTAVLYALLGAIMVSAPRWASANFAWSVSPLVAVTIGAWCLGNAWSAWTALRRPIEAAFCAALYIALFGLLQGAVAVAFRAALLGGRPLTWLYLGALAVTILFASAFAVDWWRGRAPLRRVGPPFRPLETGLTIGFIALVAFLGTYGLVAGPGLPGLNGGIFPERLSTFSLRSFGAFYLALALAAVPLLIARGRDNLLTHGFAQYGLIAAITLASLIFVDRFDFAGRPTQAAYLGIYALVGAVVGAYLVRYGTGPRGERRPER